MFALVKFVSLVKQTDDELGVLAVDEALDHARVDFSAELRILQRNLPNQVLQLLLLFELVDYMCPQLRVTLAKLDTDFTRLLVALGLDEVLNVLVVCFLFELLGEFPFYFVLLY